MKLVVNASPVIFLAKVNALSLLAAICSQVLIPPAVITEVRDLEIPDFMRRVKISARGRAFVQGAVGRLHEGELEAMIVASE